MSGPRKAVQGLIVYVYRNSFGDCSNGGLSSRVNEVTLIGDGVAGVFTPNDRRPSVRLVKRTIGGRVYVHAEPTEPCPGTGWMFGGCYLSSSDSRFHEATGVDYPIALHDRAE